MSDPVLVALITGGLSLFGTVLTIIITARKTDNNFLIAQAVTDTKIEELTREVREHNNYVHRVPLLESQMENVNKRIDAIERGKTA